MVLDSLKSQIICRDDILLVGADLRGYAEFGYSALTSGLDGPFYVKL